MEPSTKRQRTTTSEEEEEVSSTVVAKSSNHDFDRLIPGGLNPKAADMIRKYLDFLQLTPQEVRSRASGLQSMPGLFNYYHKDDLSDDEVMRLTQTIHESFSGLAFKNSQMFLDELYKHRPELLKAFRWVPFNKLPDVVGARLKGDQIRMSQWLFDTQALDAQPRRMPGSLLESRRVGSRQQVYNHAVGFRMPMDFWLDPTKLRAYNKSLQAMGKTIHQTMEREILQKLMYEGTQYHAANQYQLPFESSMHLSNALLQLRNGEFAVQKNGAGFQALETSGYNRLRNYGHTPDTVVISPELLQYEKVVNPMNRVLSKIGKSTASKQLEDPFDLQGVEGKMITPTLGMKCVTSRSFNVGGVFSDPLQTPVYNPSRWCMKPLGQHERTAEYRTAHRTIEIVDGDAEEIVPITLYDVCTKAGLWVEDGRAPGKTWSENMRKFLAAMTDSKGARLPTVGELCDVGDCSFIIRAIHSRLTAHAKDADSHPECDALSLAFNGRDRGAPNADLPDADVERILTADQEIGGNNQLDLATLRRNPSTVYDVRFKDEMHLRGVIDGFKGAMAMVPGGVAATYAQFFAWADRRDKGERGKSRVPGMADIANMLFTGQVAEAMLDADVPFPLVFNIFRMHERFRAGSIIYMNSKESMVMAIKGCNLLRSNDAQKFETNVQLKLQAGPVLVEPRSVGVQHNVVAIEYLGGAGTEFYNWNEAKTRHDGMVVVPLPYCCAPTTIYSCIFGAVPDSILPSHHQEDLKESAERVYGVLRDNITASFHREGKENMFTTQGILQPQPKDQIIAMRGSCRRYDPGQKKMVDTQEGRTSLGKACSVDQFQRLKGRGGDLAGDGIMGSSFGTTPVFG